MRPGIITTALWWKLATAFTLILSIFAIYNNSESVRKLELQVCATLHESNARIETLDYYKTHPDEKAQIKRDNMVVLRRFDCPPPPVVKEEIEEEK